MFKQEEARNPATSPQRLEMLCADPALRILVAGNPATSTHLLETLAQDQDEQVRKTVASNPNTPWPILEDLAWEFPREFFHNPVGPLQLVARPEEISSDYGFWSALLRVAPIPDLWWEWLLSQPELSDIASMHIQYAGETSSFYGTRQEGEDGEWALLTLMEPLSIACILEVALPLLRLPDQAETSVERIIREDLRWLAQSANNEMRIAVAGNELTPGEVLHTLAQNEEWIRETIAWNEQTSGETLRLLAQDKEWVRGIVMWNKQVPADVLQTLAMDKQAHIRKRVAEHKQIPADALQTLAQDQDWEVRAAVAGNERTPLELLQSLAMDEDGDVQMVVASNKQTPPELSAKLLRSLAQSGKVRVREMVAKNEQTPKEVLQTLAQDQEGRVRRAVAGNKQTPEAVLRALAQDRVGSVRYAVASNGRTPGKVLQALAQDEETKVRRAVASNEQTSKEVLQVLEQDQDATVLRQAQFVQKLLARIKEPGESEWWENLRGVLLHEQDNDWLGDAPIEEQLESISSLDVPLTLQQAILATLAADWDITKVVTAFTPTESGNNLAGLLSERREIYRHILTAYMPTVALQRLAASPSYDIRYLVALHENTLWETRQILSQDGNRYVRAMAKAKLDMEE